MEDNSVYSQPEAKKKGIITFMADEITEKIAGYLNPLTDLFDSQSEAAQKKIVMFFLAAEIVVIVLSFLLAANKIRLMLDVFYCTTPGACMNVFENLIHFGQMSMEERQQVSFFKTSFIGDSAAWIASGLQAALLLWYGNTTEKVFRKTGAANCSMR